MFGEHEQDRFFNKNISSSEIQKLPDHIDGSGLPRRSFNQKLIKVGLTHQKPLLQSFGLAAGAIKIVIFSIFCVLD